MFNEKKKLPLFLIYFFLTFILMTVQSIKGPIELFYYFKYPLLYLNESVNKITTAIKRPLIKVAALEKENETLKTHLNNLMLKEQKYNEALQENSRLKKILNVKENIDGYVTTSLIIAESPDKLSYIIILDKGGKDGVMKNMTVRTAIGLVGKIQFSNKHYSTVLLLNDDKSSVAVRLEKTRLKGVLIGKGDKRCQLNYIPNEADVETGDIVLTSGLDGIFPKGIPVGYITSIDNDKTGLFQKIEVELFEDPAYIEDVMIVKKTDSNVYRED
ncbi:rod shape-determining protein MreC [Candidatus Magnetoovum chiemensis]|nr:rod shape-determining protein MreC [Candidatus Magnetoovum chiemensis]